MAKAYGEQQLGWRLKRRRLLVAAGGVSLANLALAACSGAARRSQQGKAGTAAPSANARPQSGGIFHTSSTLNPNTLDPQKMQGDAAHIVLSPALSRLFRFKSGSDPKVGLSETLENDLAASAESPDALTWTVKLRPGAKFHNIAPVNGHAVESEDIKATFQRVSTLPGSIAAGYLVMIDKDQIDTPDADTVVLKLKYPYGPFPLLLASHVASWILPREALAGTYDPTKQVIGSGPFILTNYTPDVAANYKKNPSWFESASGGAYVDELQVSIIPSAAQKLAQFSAGKLDEFFPDLDSLGPAQQQNPKATVISVPDLIPDSIWGHLDTPSSPFQDIRVRQAISLAIDRETIGKVLFNGKYHNNGVMSWAAQGALPPDQLGSGSQYLRYDLAQAKRLVDEAGAADAFNRLAYPAANYGPLFDKLVQMVNPMLNAAGFKTQLVPLDYNTQWLAGGKGVNYGFYPDSTLLLGHGGPADVADYLLISNLSPNGSGNHARLNDPQLAQMLAKMQGTVDAKQRLQMAQDIQRFVADKVYQIVSFPTGNNTIVVQPRVQNYCYSYNATQSGIGTETYAKLWLTE